MINPFVQATCATARREIQRAAVAIERGDFVSAWRHATAAKREIERAVRLEEEMRRAAEESA